MDEESLSGGDHSAADVAADAKDDWDARIGMRHADDAQRAAVTLDPPSGLQLRVGRGQVTLDWQPVPGAIGYLVHRAESPYGPFDAVDHRGGDVLAVPHPPYTDTTGECGRTYHYAVAGIADIDDVGPLRAAPPIAAAYDGPARVRARVAAGEVVGPLHRPWRPMIGAEHLSHLLCSDHTGGRPIGAELTEALRTVHSELGVQTVRAHGIFCDDLGVYREVDGEPVYDFTGVDRVYDTLLDIGLRPVVELSFMPRDLARDPDQTVFAYRAGISPPKDWGRWADLVRAFVAHLVDRYGLAEVRDRWAFEVWNEANLEVFWSGTKQEYLRLYDVTARAVKDVDPALRVGGPASAAAAWTGDLLAHVADSGTPIDYLSTHTYGSPPLDLRPMCERHGLPDLPLLWTEWGVTPTHFNPVSDSVFAGAFLLRGMRSAAGRVEALAYWVASDHFEELGRPQRLFHGGFGLLTVGNLRKPRYWALALADRLGDDELAVDLTGDGAGGLVECWAARRPDGTVGVLLWNLTLNQAQADGDEQLGRLISLAVDGLAAPAYELRHWRVDATHSNITAVWDELGGGDWPDDAQWATLRDHDTLAEYTPPSRVEPTSGTTELEFPLPMPGISYLELTPTP